MGIKSRRIREQHDKAWLDGWRVLNDSGADIDTYDIVALTSTSGLLFYGEAAIAGGDTNLESSALMISDHVIADGDMGGGLLLEQYVITMDTSLATAGDLVYLSDAVAGAPTLSDTGVPVGVVLEPVGETGYVHLWPAYYTAGGQSCASVSDGGEDIYATTVGTEFKFKGIKAGTNVALSSDGTDVTISATGGGAAIKSWSGTQTDANAIDLVDDDGGLDYFPLADLQLVTVHGVLACRKDGLGVDNFGGLEFVVVASRSGAVISLASNIIEIPVAGGDLPAATLTFAAESGGLGFHIRCDLVAGATTLFSATTTDALVQGAS